MRHFGPEDRLSRAEDMLSTELDHETILMSIDAGAYYGLEGVAQFVWEILATPITFAVLLDRLKKEYEVAPDTCAADLESFLVQMKREGLLRVE